MITLFTILLTLTSLTAYGRQYIQCSTTDQDYSDVMVVNLTTSKTGTLFLSSGMQNPDEERILLDISFDKAEEGNFIYRITPREKEGTIRVPEAIIGKRSNSFLIDLVFAGYMVTFNCFSRLYEEK